MNVFWQYIRNQLVSIDQGINAILGGDPDETISSRLGKATDRVGVWARGVVDRIFGKGHCKKEIESDEGKDGLF